MMIISLSRTKEVFGFTLKEHLTVRKGMNFTHWKSPGAVHDFSRNVEKRIKDGFRVKILSVFERARKELLGLENKISEPSVRKLSKNELNSLFNVFCKRYENLYPAFHVGSGIYIDTIETKAKTWLEKRLKILKKESSFDDYYLELSSPEALSLIQKEQIGLLRIALAKKNLSAPNITKIMSNHVKQYAGLPVINDETEPWNKDYFEKRLKEILKKPIKEIQNEISALIKTPKTTKKNKEEAFSKLKATLLMKRYFSLIAQSTWIRLVGRNTFSIAHYFSQPLFREIGMRHYLSMEKIKWMTVPEINTLIKKDILPDKNKMGDRKKNSTLLFRNNNIDIQEGTNAIILAKKELGEEEKENKTLIGGATAYKGYAKGIVRIILTLKDLKTFNEGDILVTRMTTTELVPIVKKAGAIITDEGGITCHAAIIARELQKPCLIGTLNATKVLKDGDLIEVDTNKKLVKKTKK